MSKLTKKITRLPSKDQQKATEAFQAVMKNIYYEEGEEVGKEIWGKYQLKTKDYRARDWLLSAK